MPDLSFTPNIPARFALGSTIPGTNGRGQCVYQLQDGRDLLVTPELSRSIESLGLTPGEPFWICCYWSGKADEKAAWNVWLDPAAEKARAASEIAPEGPIVMGEDLTSVLRASIDQVQRRRKAPVRAAASASAVEEKGTGTYGPRIVPMVQPSPGKIPLNVAVRELVGIVAAALQQHGEQWSDAARQDLVSTCVIQMGKQGYLTLWERDN